MPDRISEELISAYIDDELSSKERRLVEEALAESDELSRLHAELLELRAAFGGLARYELPQDFHHRVLQRSADAGPAQPVSLPPAQAGRRPRSWTVAAATVAVVLISVLALNSRHWIDSIRWPGTGLLAGTSLVHYRPETRPKFSLVIDVSVTRQGRANRALEAVFERAGIGIDPDLVVDKRLEQTILSSRMLAGADVHAAGPDETEADDAGANDEIEMRYVVAESSRIDQIYSQLATRNRDFQMPRLSLLVQKPGDVLQRVNESSRRQFAGRDIEFKTTLAHRIVLRVSLASVSRQLASGAVVRVEATRVPAGQDPLAEVPDFEAALTAPNADAAAAAGAAQVGEMSEVLFIIRYPKPAE